MGSLDTPCNKYAGLFDHRGMEMNKQERNEKLELYGRGYDLLTATLAEVPREAWLFKPEPKEWSVYEVIIHLADSESNAALRARKLIVEPGGTLMGYDQALWADELNYHEHSYEDALDVALRYGWIDGQKKAFDDKYWLQKFTPRGPKSIWSKINTEKVERLIASGEMKPAGLKAIELAKQDGRWDAAYASQKNISVPEDFQAALDDNKKAKAFFTTLNSVNRYAILCRIHNVKKPETRVKRIQQFVERTGGAFLFGGSPRPPGAGVFRGRRPAVDGYLRLAIQPNP